MKRIDHVRMFVGNARQSAYFYRNAFGFQVIAYAGLETGVRNEACYVLRQGQITFVLASPLSGKHPNAQRIILHGDGVQTIALEVADVTAAFEHAVARGASSGHAAANDRRRIRRVRNRRDRSLRRHDSHVRRLSRYKGVFAPGFKPIDPDRYSPDIFHPVGLKAVDHIVANVEEGKIGDWSTTTARSWDSRSSPALTIRTSAPITRH